MREAHSSLCETTEKPPAALFPPADVFLAAVALVHMAERTYVVRTDPAAWLCGLCNNTEQSTGCPATHRRRVSLRHKPVVVGMAGHLTRCGPTAATRIAAALRTSVLVAILSRP
jgi:hypothetical protein